MLRSARVRWSLAAAVVIAGVGVALTVVTRAGGSAPLLSLHLAYGHLTPPFSLGAGSYHVDAQFSRCEGGVYGIYADPQTVPPHVAPPLVLTLPYGASRWQDDFTIPGPRRFLIQQSDAEASAFGQQACTADVRITRTAPYSGPPESSPVAVHCALAGVPCAIPGTLAPGSYAIRFSSPCSDWWLDGVDAEAEHLQGLDTSHYDGGTSAWVDDLSVAQSGRYAITHYVASGIADPTGGTCVIDAKVYRVSAAVPSGGPSVGAPGSGCQVSAFAATRPDPDGRSLDILATDLASPRGDSICALRQTSVRVSLVAADGAPVTAQGSPTRFDFLCVSRCYGATEGSFPPEAIEAGISPLVWSNWCGGGVHAVVDVDVDGVAAHTTLALPTPPACTAPGQATTLRRELILH